MATPRRPAIPGTLLALALAAFLAGIATARLDAPLWLDETFSAAIAGQPTFHGLVDWCLSELSGPLSYSLLWAWEKVAGNSNLALRAPGLMIFLATPLLLALKGHRDRAIAILWAVNVALWPFGFDYAAEARPYTLMVFLGCAQATCYLRLIEAPTTRRATVWAGISALAVLTHYHAAVISGIQGLLYLLIWRGRAARTWPALLVLLPLAGWMTVHLHSVLAYANSGQTWYSLLTRDDALIAVLFMFGSLATASVAVLLLPLAVHAHLAATRTAGARLLRWTPELAVIASGFGAVAVVVAVGFFRPSMTLRYLTPYLGATALLVPVVLRAVRPVTPLAAPAFVLLATGSVIPEIFHRLTTHEDPVSFNLEQPTDWLRANGHPRKVVFLWDNPIALLAQPAKLADMAGFFFRRAGQPVEVLIPRYALRGDPYPAVRALAAGRADTAVIWSFDRAVPGTSALLHPVGVLTDGAGWTCRDFGQRSTVVLACLPSASRAPRHGRATATDLAIPQGFQSIHHISQSAVRHGLAWSTPHRRRRTFETA